jgi:hypothetical protein
MITALLSCRSKTIANINRDLTGIQFENRQVNDQNNGTLYCIQGTLTGFHRVFTTDELYNNDEPQKLKDDYVGRIVVFSSCISGLRGPDAIYIYIYSIDAIENL